MKKDYTAIFMVLSIFFFIAFVLAMSFLFMFSSMGKLDNISASPVQQYIAQYWWIALVVIAVIVLINNQTRRKPAPGMPPPEHEEGTHYNRNLIVGLVFLAEISLFLGFIYIFLFHCRHFLCFFGSMWLGVFALVGFILSTIFMQHKAAAKELEELAKNKDAVLARIEKEVEKYELETVEKLKRRKRH